MIDFKNTLKIHASIIDHRLNNKLYHVLKELAIYGRTTTIKSVSGNNKKYHWRRSPLKGFHYYLWWFRKKSEIVIRSIRHHDNHNDLTEGLSKDYFIVQNLNELREVIIPDMLVEQLLPPLKTYHQTNQTVSTRFLRGAPGTGKTTILRELAESYSQNDHILFISRSLELNRFSYPYIQSVTDARVDTLHLPSMLTILQENLASRSSVSEERKSFLFELKKRFYQVPRDQLPIYYELTRAYTFGMSDYDKENEKKSFSYEFNCIKIDALNTIAKIFKGHPLFGLQRIATQLLSNAEERLALKTQIDALNVRADRLLVLIDEIQDHTSLEIDLLLAYILDINANYNRGIELIFSGDEGQSIYPTRFTWAMLSRKIELQSNRFERSSNHERSENLRSLPQITELIFALDQYYYELPTDLRPTIKSKSRNHDQTYIASEDTSFDHSLYILKTDIQRFTKDIIRLINRNSLFISLYDLPEDLKSIATHVWEVDDVKGLEAQNAFIICDDGLIIEDEIPIYTRMKLDRIRVSISRATQKVIFISIDSILPDLDKHLRKLVRDDTYKTFRHVSFDELTDILEGHDSSRVHQKTIDPPKSIIEKVKSINPLKLVTSKSEMKQDTFTIEDIDEESFRNEFIGDSLINPNLIELEEIIDQCKFIRERSHEKSYQLLVEAIVLAFGSQDHELISIPDLLDLYETSIIDENLNLSAFSDYVDHKLNELNLVDHERLILEYMLTSRMSIFREVLGVIERANISMNLNFQGWIKHVSQSERFKTQHILNDAKISAVELFCAAVDRGIAGVNDIKQLISWRADLVQDSDKYSVYLKNYFYFNLEPLQKESYVNKRFTRWLSRSMLPFDPQMSYNMAGINFQSLGRMFNHVKQWPAAIADQVLQYLTLKHIPSGSTIIGDNNSQFKDEAPEHKVFLKGNTQVSQSLISEKFWNMCIAKSVPTHKEISSLHREGNKKSLHWIEAILFCNLLSKKLGLTPVYFIDETYGLVMWNPLRKGIRLLTEIEWEVIAWESLDSSLGVIKDNKEQIIKEARKRRKTGAANMLGIKDIGIMPEWVYDSFDEEAYKSRKDKYNIEPIVDDMIIFNRLQRGESSVAPDSALSLTKRFSHSGPMMQNGDSSFRVAIG